MKTADEILDAIEEFCHADASGEAEVWFSKGIRPLVERLALAMRVLELVENEPRDHHPTGTVCAMILAKAKEGEK